MYDTSLLEIVENYRFHLRKQAEDKTVEEYSIALRHMAIHCNFGNYLDTTLRNQFIFGLRSQRTQHRLLETDKLTVETALATAKTMELSAKGGAEIQQQKESKQSVSCINQKSAKRTKNRKACTPSTNSKPDGALKKKEFCYHCGKKDHRADRCSLANSTCSFCNEKGHLQSVCFKAKAEKRQTNYIDADYMDTGSIDEIFHLISNEIIQSDRSKILINLLVNDIVSRFRNRQWFSGTIISNEDKCKHFRAEILRPTDTKLVSYCGTKITVLDLFCRSCGF